MSHAGASSESEERRGIWWEDSLHIATNATSLICADSFALPRNQSFTRRRSRDSDTDRLRARRNPNPRDERRGGCPGSDARGSERHALMAWLTSLAVGEGGMEAARSPAHPTARQLDRPRHDVSTPRARSLGREHSDSQKTRKQDKLLVTKSYSRFWDRRTHRSAACDALSVTSSSLSGEQSAKNNLRNESRPINTPPLCTEDYLKQPDDTCQKDRSSLTALITLLYTEDTVGKHALGIPHPRDRSNKSTCIPQCMIVDEQAMRKSSICNNTHYSLSMGYAESRDHWAEKPSAPRKRRTIFIENSSQCKLLDSTPVHSGEFSECCPEGTGQGRKEGQIEQPLESGSET